MIAATTEKYEWQDLILLRRFRSSRTNIWLEWLDAFARFRIAKGDVHRDWLLYAIGGRQANRIFRTLTFIAPAVDTEYEMIVSKLAEYFIQTCYMTRINRIRYGFWRFFK